MKVLKVRGVTIFVNLDFYTTCAAEHFIIENIISVIFCADAT